MSVHNFWTVFLKALGVWLVISGFTTVTQFTTGLFSVLSSGGNDWLNIIYVSGISTTTILFYFFVLWLFLFRTSWLIDKLRLEKGFKSETIEFDMQYFSLLNIAIIVMGGLMLVDSLPLFCRETFKYFEQKRMFVPDFSSQWIFFYLVKSVLGYFMLTNSQRIINFIRKQNQPKNTDTNPE